MTPDRIIADRSAEPKSTSANEMSCVAADEIKNKKRDKKVIKKKKKKRKKKRRKKEKGDSH